MKCDHPVASMRAAGKLSWYYQRLVMGLVRRAAMHDDLNFYWTTKIAARTWAQFYIEFRYVEGEPRYVFIGELVEDPDGDWEPPVAVAAETSPAPVDTLSAESSIAVFAETSPTPVDTLPAESPIAVDAETSPPPVDTLSAECLAVQ